MSNIDDGGPAFPRPVGDLAIGGYGPTYETIPAQDGMSLRDYFAAAALQGMLSDYDFHGGLSDEKLAKAAYSQADAMLAARKAVARE